MNKINQLEQRKMENNEEKKRLTEQKDALTEEIRDVKQSKQSEIAKLKKSIEEMSSEFASMLKDTLNKMKMKIEAANDKWAVGSVHVDGGSRHWLCVCGERLQICPFR